MASLAASRIFLASGDGTLTVVEADVVTDAVVIAGVVIIAGVVADAAVVEHPELSLGGG